MPSLNLNAFMIHYSQKKKSQIELVYENTSQIKFYTLINILILLFIGFSFISCHSIKPTTSKNNSNLYETFFIGEKGTQYYIKPITLKDSFKNKIIIDFSFRYKNEIIDSSIINFSIISQNNIFKAVDSLIISNKKETIKPDNINLLFNEIKSGKIISRFTCKISLHDLRLLFRDDKWRVNAFSRNGENIFYVNKKSSKKISLLNKTVFFIIEE